MPAPKKKGRPSKGDKETLHARIPVKTMRKLEQAAERRRWSKTVAVEELIERFADKL